MTSEAPASPATTTPVAGAVFERILVGIDETPESLVAAAQAAVLRASLGQLVLVAIAERHLAAHAGLAATDAAELIDAGTWQDLVRAREIVAADDAILHTGRLVRVLVRERERRGATLVAIGARPRRHGAALALGGHDVEALRHIPCSVLIARPGWGLRPPERIVVGVDGLHESRAAELVARQLAERLGCELVPVIGLADTFDLALLRTELDDALLDPGRLVDAVAGTATRASLVVLGAGVLAARGKHHSLVEQIVFGVSCSVLALRDEPVAHRDPASG
ncbi:MAG: universal stress protein [Gaiella sp.]|nr:universal stress protein [Gaiella sp.]